MQLTRFPARGAVDAVPDATAGSTGPRVRLAWLARAIGLAMAAYVQLVVRTARFDGELTVEQAVVATWHEANLVGLVAALMRRRHLPHASFSTRGFRGIVVTTLLQRFGVHVLPLPPESDRAVARTLSLTMARLAAHDYSLSVTCDGPFGPPRVAKPGALFIARAAGIPIIPMSPGARPAVRLRRWDRHIVPLPFATVWVAQGEPLSLPERAPIGTDAVRRLQQELNVLAAQTERRMRRPRARSAASTHG